MADERLGTVFVEVKLDSTKMERQQQKLLADIKAIGVEGEAGLTKSFQNLGVKTDQIYTLMANKAIASYQRITAAANTSASEQVRAQAAMVAKINSLNMEMARNPLYEAMGIRSVAAINAQKAAVIASYDTIKGSGAATAQDLVNIERAKNAKLKELNKEMVGQHDMSMASMMRAILRFYAAYYVISNVIRTITDTIMGGVKAIDNMKISVIGVAAQITTMQGTTGDIVENYKNNLLYAKALVPVLMQIDASSFANLSQIQRMNTAMTLQGTILDVNNKKQLEAFTALSNAVALFTQGQDKERQAAQEIRALFTGQVRAGNQVALMMDGLIRKQGEYRDGLKGLIAEGNKHGDTLERMMPYLSGIIAASGDISMTWEAVSSSLETSWNIIQRRLFSGIYEDMTKAGREFADWLRNEDSSLHQFVRRLEQIKVGIQSLIDLIPEGVGGPVTYGILGRLLFGSTPVGVFITALTLSKDMLDRLGVAAWKARTEAEWAAAAIAVMAKQSGMFGGGEAGKPSGAGREFALETPKVISSEIDEEALKDAYDFLKLKEDAETEYLKNVAAAYLEKYKNDVKLTKEGLAIYLKGIEDRKKADKELSDAGNKATGEAISLIEKEIEAGMKLTKQSLDRPQKEADEARKMVTFYQDMIGMEDEYRQAKLDWIEKEAKVKFDGMDKELLKERWMKDQRIKFEQEIFDAKAKQIEQGLGDMSSMFNSLSGMYDKNSGEYARLQEAANAMIVLQKAVAVVNAVAAVAASAAAPFPAGFVAMAAMAAAMGSLLGSIGVSFAGGDVSAPSAAYGIGTTTLGGENYSGSESISKTWELLEDTYDLEKVTLTGIYENMKQLNANITGIVRGIVSGDMGNISPGGLGKTSTYYDAIYNIPIWGEIERFASRIPILGPLAQKVVNWAFGGSETTLTGSGIMVGGGGVRPFSQTRTETSGFLGGLFGGGGSSESRAIGAIDATLTNLFYGEHGIYTTLKKSVSEMAVILGADVAMAENKVFEAFELNFIGKTPEEIEKIVSRKISEIGDKFSSEVFGDLIRTYQQVGEGALETASRLAIDLLSVTDILGMTGKTIVSVSIELSESLIEIAGGLDRLSEAASTYYDKFFSDEEKHIRVRGILTEQMSRFYMTLPTTREEYRKLVDLQLEDIENKQEEYWALIKLSEYADEYYKTLEELAEKASNAIKEALGAVSSEVDKLISMSRSAASEARSAADAYRNIIETLTAAQNKIRGGGESGRVASVFALAMTGNQEALRALPGAFDDLLASSLKTSKSAEDYARDQGKALIQLEQAKMVSQGMVNWQEYTASLYEIQTGVLKEIKEELEKPNPSMEILNKQAAMLETIAGLLQEQTTQIVSGSGMQAVLMHDQTGQIILANGLTVDQTGKIVLGNSWLAAQDAIGVLANELLVDQTGKITLGNSLSGVQTSQIITGNATSDAIKNISALNTSYSEEMLTQLAMSGSIQTTSLQNIVMQTALTVAAIQQLIQLTATTLAAQEAALAQAEADRLAALAAAAAAKSAADAVAAAAAAKAVGGVAAPQRYWNQYGQEYDPHQMHPADWETLTSPPTIIATDPYQVWLEQYEGSQFWAANGAVFSSGNVIPFASGGIYDRPTLFPMANRTGLMGEDGPEAIMPLTRIGGKLGVSAVGNNVILIEEVRALRASIEAGNLQLVKNTLKTAKVLERCETTDGTLSVSTA